MDRSDFKAKREKFRKLGIDELITQLASRDLQTRFFAEIALRDATST
jgi:hypothetical protein